MRCDESSAILASYCNGYTDREEFENEKRRKKMTLPVLSLFSHSLSITKQ